ncbi:MAG: hypothetical protein ACRCYU_21060, partial [Nocardioides sp.]
AFWVQRNHTQFPDESSEVYSASSGREFDSLGELAASSDLVVRARVIDVNRGASVEYDDGSDAKFTQRTVTLQVVRTFYVRDGSISADRIELWDGYWTDGVGFAREGVPWIDPGDTGYFFVHTADGAPGQYSLVGDGRVMITEDGVVYAGDPELWGRHTGGEDGMKDALLDAVDAAKSGAAKPVPYEVCRPSDPDDENSEPICDQKE